ncbi:PREDICTED: ras-related protein Rap-1 isoform X2 [Nicrophorus vespilloides]|uniref:Ras-related protein Rap-1 isoform X2 n=1 Tax=Nicrophorus vespilloides TaxID=110193 RepID=A0ABM1MSQ2_NICVS|nr:PREDICTED: ras-related protein Rap-1 isoform X2 [Nicrophorus vespilloides]
MKGRHQFRRRFSLQPSFLKEEQEDERNSHPPRSQRSEDAESLEKGVATANVRHKIVVMGAAKVGKSSLISQFLYGTFSPKYKRTVEEMHHSDFNVAGVHLMLDILDTSGAYEFPAMRALSISSADAFILVYDVTDANTFEEARALRDQIHETKGGTDIPIVIVGNKVDLVGNREVDTATTESVVTVDWENGFVEASAKENINVSKVFKELLVQAKVKYNLSPALRRRRRQSLPLHAGGPAGHAAPSHNNPSSTVIPSAVQLQHLQQIRDRHGKRNSCIIS